MPTVLLVDDQRDILRLLHSALDTLKLKDLEIIESPSGEEAMLAVVRRKVDLLVSDYYLPGMNGLELMHKMRLRHPDVRVILITGMTDRKIRDDMRNAGAIAIFDKPIPLADFLDTVERSLGVVRTIFPTETDTRLESRRARISDLLANFRQDMGASAVFLLNDRGLVVARAGDLRDSSLEVSLVSALNAIFSAGLKVAKSNRQDKLDQYFVFNGGDDDLLLMPVDPTYALLLSGRGLADRDRVADTLNALSNVRDSVGHALRSMGVTAELKESSTLNPPTRRRKTGQLSPAPEPEPGLEALLKKAGHTRAEDVDAFWDQAASQHANKTTDPDVIPYDKARQLGLAPDKK